MSSVIVENMTKQYPKSPQVALDHISFDVLDGELFGLIGPDGAGKTTLFRILTTVLLADKGKATVCGWDVVKDYKKIRHAVGYMPGKFSLYQDLSVEENLRFFATLFNTTIEKNYHLIRDIYSQIEPFKHRRAGKLSGGMKQKLALSCALIHEPRVLFLDEPTTGVDPVSRKEFWDMLDRLKERGITILVSTPYMDEAVRCDRIALLQEGKLMRVDTPQQITFSFPEKLYAVRHTNMSLLLKTLLSIPVVKSSYAFGESAHVILKEEHDALKHLQEAIWKAGLTDVTIEPARVTIEDSFIHLMRN